MSVLRAPVTPALMLLLLLPLLVSAGRRTTEHQTDPAFSDMKDYSAETLEGNKVNKSYQQDQILEVFPRDLRQKEKLLKHLTGPLYFSPKCSKHFYRLYHNTRDCTVPAFYKRCARLLRRLAESHRCSEG